MEVNLYKTLHAVYLLVDDKRARKVARLNQITITGSQGFLLFAKQKGLSHKSNHFLTVTGFRYSYQRAIKIQKIFQLGTWTK